MRIQNKTKPSLPTMLVRGSMAAGSVSVIGAALAFVLHLLLARILGAVEYGGYIYALTWILVLSLIGRLGFDTALLRFVAVYSTKKKWGLFLGIIHKSTQYTLFASILLAIFLAIGAWISYRHSNPPYALTFLFGCFLIPVLALAGLRQAILRALKRVVLAHLPEAIVHPLMLMLLVFFIGSQVVLNSSVIMLLTLIAAIFALFFGTFLLEKNSPAQIKQAQPKYLTNEWVTISIPLLFVSGIHLLLNQIDTLMIGLLSSTTSAGIYAVAARISALILFGMQAINTIAAPMIAQYYGKNSRTQLQNLVSRIAKLIFLVSLPILVFVWIWGHWVLGFFGAEFQSAYPILLILSIGQFLNISMGPVGFLLTMTGHQQQSLHVLTFVLILNILLNIPAILFYGMIGAAISTAFCIALRNILMWCIVRKHVGVDSSFLSLLEKKT